MSSPTASYRHIARNITIFGGVQAFSVLAAVLRNKVSAVFVGAVGLGTNTLYWTLSQFISTLAGLGLSFSAVASLSADYGTGDVQRIRKTGARLRRLEVILAILGGLITLAAAPFLSRHYHGDLTQTLTFSALSPIVAGLIVSGIELAIVKACQQTHRLAIATIVGAALTVLLTAPFYILWGLAGIMPALVTCTVVTAAVNVWYGHKTLPYSLGSNEALRPLLRAVWPILTLGGVSLVTGLVSYGVELLIQSYLAVVATMATVGLYRAGYQMSVGYIGMLFTAVSNDYYPRLAAASGDITQRNRMARRQSLVQLAFAVVAVALFEWLAPWLVPLLFSDEFLAAVPMARWAMLGTFFIALETPLDFLPVVLHKNLHFLLLEVAGLVLLCCGAVAGYAWQGLVGSGIGIVVARAANLVMVYAFCRYAYGFHYLPHHSSRHES